MKLFKIENKCIETEIKEPPKSLNEPEPTIQDDFGDFDDSDESVSSEESSDSYILLLF